MDYEELVNRIIKQDKRNKFSVCQKRNYEIPSEIYSFYNKYNPLDVEIVLKDLTAIRLYNSSNFKGLADEYNIKNKNGIIFATWEGDPIYTHDNHIFIKTHGSGVSDDKKIFNDIDEFFTWILREMK